MLKPFRHYSVLKRHSIAIVFPQPSTVNNCHYSSITSTKILSAAANAKHHNNNNSSSSSSNNRPASNHAVNYLIAHYESVRDASVKQTLEKVDTFLPLRNDNSNNSNSSKAADLSRFTKSLVTEFYRSLQPVPWLQFHSPPISFIQFILNDAVAFYLNPVADSKQMVELSGYADEMAAQNLLDAQSLASVLHHLLLLGLPKSHSLVRRFFDKINDNESWLNSNNNIPSNLSQLNEKLLLFGEVGKINRLMGTRVSEEIRLVIQNLSATVRHTSVDEVSLEGITALLAILSSRMALNTADELAIGRLALQYLKRRCGHEPLSARFFSLLFAWLSQHRGPSLNNVLDSVAVSRRQLLDFVYTGLSEIAPTLSDVDIAELCSELKRSHCYPGRLMRIVQQRALLLCSGSYGRPLDIRMLSNSFYALDNTCDPYLIRFFTEKFADHLDNADVLLISNIAENLQHVNRSLSPEFRDLFLSHCERLSSGIVSHMTRLGRVLQFLESIPPIDIAPKFNARFCAELVAQLEKKHESRRLPCQMIFPYLICNFASNVPDSLYHRLLAILPQFKLAALDKLLQAIRNAPVLQHHGPSYRQKATLLRSVRSAIYRRVSELVDTSNLSDEAAKALSVGQLFRMARTLLKAGSTTPTGQVGSGFIWLSSSEHQPATAGDSGGSLRMSFSSVMETLAKNLEVINATYAHQLSDLLLAGSYYNENLLIRLEEFVTGEDNEGVANGGLPLLLNIVRAMAAVGYEPMDPVRFGNTISNFIVGTLQAISSNSQSDNSAVLAILRIANGLSIMRCFPKALLSHIFSPAFLEQVDQLLAETGESSVRLLRRGTLHDHIRETLMRLNRAVVLECPEPGVIIPWFHDKYRMSPAAAAVTSSTSSSNRSGYSTSRATNNYFSSTREWAFKEQVRCVVEQVVSSQTDYCLLTDQTTKYYHWIDFEIMPTDDDDRHLPKNNADSRRCSATSSSRQYDDDDATIVQQKPSSSKAKLNSNSPVAIILLSGRQFVNSSVATTVRAASDANNNSNNTLTAEGNNNSCWATYVSGSESSAVSNRLLRGSVKQVIRQLEMLNFRVVAISPNDWTNITMMCNSDTAVRNNNNNNNNNNKMNYSSADKQQQQSHHHHHHSVIVAERLSKIIFG